MQCTIHIRMDNAAFEMEPGSELARILRVFADAVEDNNRDMLLNEYGPHEPAPGMRAHDTNGNTVGHLVVKP